MNTGEGRGLRKNRKSGFTQDGWNFENWPAEPRHVTSGSNLLRNYRSISIVHFIGSVMRSGGK